MIDFNIFVYYFFKFSEMKKNLKAEKIFRNSYSVI